MKVSFVPVRPSRATAKRRRRMHSRLFVVVEPRVFLLNREWILMDAN